MGWVTEALAELRRGRPAKVRPQGGSMRGRIESGQLVTLEPLSDASKPAVNDVVLVRWKGNHILHVVKDIRDNDIRGKEILIGNNLGKINGWASMEDVIAIVTAVQDSECLGPHA
jgi:hypothetical protein